jgi:hypothetical protein
MKKELILGSFLAFYATMNSQGWFPGGPYSTPLQIEIGTGSGPVFSQLDVNTTDPLPYSSGQSIFQRGADGSAALHLNPYNVGGYAWGLYSLGHNNHVDATTTGDFCIYEEITGYPAVIVKNTTGRVGIGTISPISKLQVETPAAAAGAFISSGFGGGHSIGVIANSVGWNPSTSLANIGVDAFSDTQTQGLGTAFGVWGTATNGRTCWAGRFEGQATSGSAQNIGLYAGTNGIGSSVWAGYFNGDMNVNGDAYCTLSAWSSDRKLKKNIQPMTQALEKLSQLKPSTYFFRKDEFKNMNLPSDQQMGLIAQELEEVFPELIKTVKAVELTDKEGKVTSIVPEHKAVNYIGLVPVLIAGVKEQQAMIDAQQKTIAQQSQINADLQKQLNEQKQLIDNLSQKVSGTTGLNSANGSVETGFQMSQNEPNPFTHETVVKYTLPQTVASAFMAVYDLSGKQISTFPINQEGSASITITSEKLAAGIYIYSIVADGKVVDSKRMIVADK